MRVGNIGVDVSGRQEYGMVPWIIHVTGISVNGCVGFSEYLGGGNVGGCSRIASL